MEQQFSFLKTYRYELLGNTTDPGTVIYVLHGYGQLAKFFIRKFQVLSESMLIVAPEGMHRFYLEGNSGRVGASWMTKEARETDIEDNMAWLQALNEEIDQKYAPKTRLLLGFSQGGATAARWHAKKPLQFDGLILWACVFPPDLLIPTEKAPIFNGHFVLGDEDPFYTNQQSEELVRFYEAKKYAIHRFNGGHDIVPDTLVEIVTQIKQGVHAK